MTDADALIEQLCDLTKRWNNYDLIPEGQKSECRRIGRELNAIGGIGLMRDAYYAARGANPWVHVIQAYWDGIGDWVW